MLKIHTVAIQKNFEWESFCNVDNFSLNYEFFLHTSYQLVDEAISMLLQKFSCEQPFSTLTAKVFRLKSFAMHSTYRHSPLQTIVSSYIQQDAWIIRSTFISSLFLSTKYTLEDEWVAIIICTKMTRLALSDKKSCLLIILYALHTQEYLTQ